MCSPPSPLRSGIRSSLVLAALALLAAGCLPPNIAARAMLTPRHSRVGVTGVVPELRHLEVAFDGEGGIELRGWYFPAESPRGTVIYLHGRNRNRAAGVAVAEALVPLGYSVLAYDSRAHGESGGRYSTFGYWEKRDLSRAIDFLGAPRVVAMGTSLGAAVAIQAAAEDERIAGVVAISTFSSMEEVVRERLPGIVPDQQIEAAFRAAERRADMDVDEADAVAAARRIDAPVLLLHGDADRFVRPAHARRVFDALSGPKELVLIPGATHGDVLSSREAWRSIVEWLRRLAQAARMASRS
jgi:pimeloyl-ACP methyl ester carboxylesterase